MAKATAVKSKAGSVRKKAQQEEIPPEGREMIMSWIEDVIMERVRAVRDNYPEVLKTKDGQDWLRLRDILRIEVVEHCGALSEESLRDAMEVLNIETQNGKPSILRSGKAKEPAK